MATTNHLQITLLEQAQAQKEVTVNEGLVRIDALLNAGALTSSSNVAPASPASGDLHIVGASPTGVWAGKARQIAHFNQIWRFITPTTGSIIWAEDVRRLMVFRSGNWAGITVAL